MTWCSENLCPVIYFKTNIAALYDVISQDYSLLTSVISGFTTHESPVQIFCVQLLEHDEYQCWSGMWYVCNSFCVTEILDFVMFVAYTCTWSRCPVDCPSVDKRTKVTWILIYYYPCKFLVETNVIFFVAFRWPLGCIIHRVFGMSRGSNCWWCMWYYPDTFPALSSHCNSLLRGGYRWDPRLPRSSNELLWHLWMYTLMWW